MLNTASEQGELYARTTHHSALVRVFGGRETFSVFDQQDECPSESNKFWRIVADPLRVRSQEEREFSLQSVLLDKPHNSYFCCEIGCSAHMHFGVSPNGPHTVKK